MPVVKTSLSIEEELLNEAKAISGPRGVSSLVSDSLRREIQRRRLLTTLDEMLAENPPTLEELQRARKAVQSVVAYTDEEMQESLPDSLARDSDQASA